MRLPLLMVLTAVLAGVVVAEPPPDKPATTSPAETLRCRIAVPERGVVMLTKGGPPLHVVLENVSHGPVAIADEWNSWGFYTVTIRYTTPDGKSGTIEKIGREWSKNFLTTTSLQPGQVIVRDVPLDPALWTGLPGAGSVTATAIFKQDGLDGAENQKVPGYWAGVAESKPITFEIHKTP